MGIDCAFQLGANNRFHPSSHIHLPSRGCFACLLACSPCGRPSARDLRPKATTLRGGEGEEGSVLKQQPPPPPLPAPRHNLELAITVLCTTALLCTRRTEASSLGK